MAILDNGFQGIFQFGFGHHARDLINHFAIFKKDKGRYGFDAEFSRRDGVVINIAFGEFDLITVGFRQLFDDRADGFAWTAPWCPKVHNRWFVGLNNFSLEAAIVNIHYSLCHNFSFLSSVAFE